MVNYSFTNFYFISSILLFFLLLLFLLLVSSLSCRNLVHLSLCYCEHISDTGVELVSRIPSLIDLDITGCGLTDQVHANYNNSPIPIPVTVVPCNYVIVSVYM